MCVYIFYTQFLLNPGKFFLQNVIPTHICVWKASPELAYLNIQAFSDPSDTTLASILVK